MPERQEDVDWNVGELNEKIIIARANSHATKTVHVTGCAVIALIALACLYIFVFDSGSANNAGAEKILLLIIGSLLGALYRGSSNSND